MKKTTESYLRSRNNSICPLDSVWFGNANVIDEMLLILGRDSPRETNTKKTMETLKSCLV